MAPNKKKKKATSNPARGFATVSVASKVKTSDLEDEAPTNSAADTPANASDPNEGTSTTADELKPHPDIDEAMPIKDMNPDELEAHLEDAELQALLDAKSMQCKADAARQVSRLHVERRQLRTQAHKLYTRDWLEDQALDKLLVSPSVPSPLRSGPVLDTFSSSDSSRLLDLWTLQRVLTALRLTHVPEAVAHIVLLALQGQILAESGLIWGLVEAFDWYAQHITESELPDYDTEPTQSNILESGIAQPPNGLNMLDHPSLCKVSVQQPTPKEAVASLDGLRAAKHITNNTHRIQDFNRLTTQLVHEPWAFANKEQEPGSQADTVVAEDISSESEDDSDTDCEFDNDPDALVATYLHLQRRLWSRQRGNKSRKHKDPKSRKIQEKITAIERDILFDKAAAEAHWSLIEIELQAEEGKKQKAATNVEVKEPDGKSLENMQHENADEGDDEMFGDIFTAPGEELREPQEGASSQSIRLIDFGKWSGLAPRQLLEQACQAVDPRATVKTTAITDTRYSVRHRIDIYWSTPCLADSFAIAALPDSLSSSIQARRWSIAMESVATSNTEQSVAYVSTMMLFLVLLRDGKDQSSIIRLPSVWRDEYQKLRKSRAELINESDKAELLGLRKLIKEQEANILAVETSKIESRIPDRPLAASRPRRHDNTYTDLVRIIQDWRDRVASRPYQEMQKQREELPIFAYKNLILETISSHPCSIVCAETGSGKSTQTGSYILERELSQGRDCRIRVTQPRRISAISLARRVSSELGEAKNDLGTLKSLIGYAIRLESKTSASTRLTFATTGVLLRMLESSPNLEELDYLILDEVHERTIEMDLLFIALRRLQQRRPTGLKIVLMSATVDARKFSAYFGNAPILDIPGRTFPVEIKFLEDALEETNNIKGIKMAVEEEELSEDDTDASRIGSPAGQTNLDGYSNATRKRLSGMDEYRIDYDLVTRLAIAIATKPKFAKYSSAILVFLPGIAEIRRLQSALVSTDCFSVDWDIHMLHSSFSIEDLERAFVIPTDGRRKIVLATNIAETGITIPDVTAVIDTCKEKIMRFDERRQLSKLTEGFISRSSAKQRRGRAARVQDGVCFHLVTRYRHDNQMLEQQLPEMMRLSLQDPILRVKIWNLGSIEDTFQAAIDPPSRKNILRAIERLKDAGALTRAEQLSALGQRIARLPLDVTFAKLAILAAIFKCADPVLAMISLLSSKSVFQSSPPASNASAAFARSDSDILSALAAYEGWKKAKRAGRSAEFCRKNHLSEQNLIQVEDQKIQLIVYLVDGGSLSFEPEEKVVLNRARLSSIRKKDLYQIPQRYDKKVGDDMLLSLIAMAFYPRVLTREGNGWRNVYTNQQVSLRKESINHNGSKSPKWLSFSEAMQTKAGSLNVFETSRIPDVAMAVLLGEADVKLFSGVITLDNGRVKLAVRHWRQALALKHLREGVRQFLERRYRGGDESLSATDNYWMEALVGMTQS